MSRYIDADLLLENLKKQYGEDLGWQCTVNMSDVGMMIEDAPAADVQEVRRGKWLPYRFGLEVAMCSICGAAYEGGDFFRFCPRCGAKMDGEHEQTT